MLQICMRWILNSIVVMNLRVVPNGDHIPNLAESVRRRRLFGEREGLGL